MPRGFYLTPPLAIANHRSSPCLAIAGRPKTGPRGRPATLLRRPGTSVVTAFYWLRFLERRCTDLRTVDTRA